MLKLAILWSRHTKPRETGKVRSDAGRKDCTVGSRIRRIEGLAAESDEASQISHLQRIAVPRKPVENSFLS
jgi:hypothetical protein